MAFSHLALFFTNVLAVLIFITFFSKLEQNNLGMPIEIIYAIKSNGINNDQLISQYIIMAYQFIKSALMFPILVWSL